RRVVDRIKKDLSTCGRVSFASHHLARHVHRLVWIAAAAGKQCRTNCGYNDEQQALDMSVGGLHRTHFATAMPQSLDPRPLIFAPSLKTRRPSGHRRGNTTLNTH